jgi:ribosomal protein S18 acetylase RimI-like enzyme
VVGPAGPADAGAVLTVQRAAYVAEAQLYGDPAIPPLTETLDEVRAAVAAGAVLVARDGHRVVGAVRARVDGDVCHIGRLVVAPDAQSRGIGTALLAAVEAAYAGRAREVRLFTGERSEANLRLYRRAGYAVVGAQRVADHLTLVHLSKPLHRPPSMLSPG